MILDDNGNRLTTVSATIAPGADGDFSLPIECRDGYIITGESDDPDVAIFGKANPGDSYQDIILDPIDVSAFAPIIRDFFFRIEVAGGADHISEIIYIDVRRP